MSDKSWSETDAGQRRKWEVLFSGQINILVSYLPSQRQVCKAGAGGNDPGRTDAPHNTLHVRAALVPRPPTAAVAKGSSTFAFADH
jgi:hypothetical protein